MPLRLLAEPSKAEAFQYLPRGPGIPSALRAWTIRRGERPETYSAKYALHDGRLALIDDTSSAIPAVAHDIKTRIISPARDTSFFDATPLSSLRLRAQVSDILLRKCTLDVRHQRGRLAAIGCQQLHVSKGESSEDVGEVATLRLTRSRLRQDTIELARLGGPDQGL